MNTQAKNEEKNKIEPVSLAAHQLRTPLSAVRFSLKMLLGGSMGKISGEQKEVLEKTYKKVEEMISLVNDLLGRDRIYGSLEKTPTDMEEIVSSVINSCAEEMEMKKIAFECEKPAEKIPKIMADGKKIKLVVQNLFDNAIKYTPAGGKIVSSLKTDGKEVVFRIRDSGIGIPEDQKKRLFNKFFQAANAAGADTGGFGLGLFIAKNIINAHNGKIWFDSKENAGSTFYFSLPVVEKQQDKE